MRIDEEKLIQEVKKRRPLWDPRMKVHQSRELKWRLWNEVAASMNISRDAAQKKFKNMKDIFRRELRRFPGHFIERTNSVNSINSEMDSTSSTSSKWRLFDDMVFIKDCLDVRGPRLKKAPKEDSSTDLENFDSELSDSITETFATFDGMTSSFTTLEPTQPTISSTPTTTTTHIPRREFPSRSTQGSKKIKSIDLGSLTQILSTDNEKNYHDDDYNFLISFYPYIKKMPELSKLQFRVRMQELLYNTMADIEATNSLSNALQVQISYASPSDVEGKPMD